MFNNPFNEMLSVMREEGKRDNPPSIIIGEVINSPPEIEVKFNDIVIDKDNIYISQYLLVDYERTFEIIEGKEEGQDESVFSYDIANGEFSGDVVTEKTGMIFNGTAEGTITTSDGGTFTVSDDGHKHDINSFSTTNNNFTAKGTIKLTSTLQEGDLVAIMPTYDRQMFIVLDKVVTMA